MDEVADFKFYLTSRLSLLSLILTLLGFPYSLSNYMVAVSLTFFYYSFFSFFEFIHIADSFS